MSPTIYLLTKSDCSFRCPTNTTSTHTCSRHARFQALLKPTVAAGVARARVDDAISGQFARVRRVLDQSAAKELLKRTCIIHQHSTIYTRDSFDVDVASVVRRPRWKTITDDRRQTVGVNDRRRGECQRPTPKLYAVKQVALLSRRGRAMLRDCIASIQNFERSLLLLVVSASDIPLRTIKFFSVLFSSPYWSMLQAVTNKHSLVRRRLCDLHCMVFRNCFCHFVVRTSSNQSSYLTRITISAYTPPAFNAPVRGLPVGISPPRLVWKN